MPYNFAGNVPVVEVETVNVECETKLIMEQLHVL